MKIDIQVTDEDVHRVRVFHSRWVHHGFVQARIRRNVRREHAPVTKAGFWDALVGALLTTQQRSGPDAPISRLVKAKPFPLMLDLLHRPNGTRAVHCPGPERVGRH